MKGIIAEEELLKVLRKMPNDKSPRNDKITKEFYEDLKTPFLLSINKAFKVLIFISERGRLISDTFDIFKIERTFNS